MFRLATLAAFLAAYSIMLMAHSSCDPHTHSPTATLTTDHDGDVITVAKQVRFTVTPEYLPTGAALTAVEFYRDGALVFSVPPAGLSEPSFGYFFTPDPGTYSTDVYSDVTYDDAGNVSTITSITIRTNVDIPGPPCDLDIGGHCAKTLTDEALALWQIGIQPSVSWPHQRAPDQAGLLVPSFWIAFGCNSPGLVFQSQIDNCNAQLPTSGGYCDTVVDAPTGEIVEATAVINPSTFVNWDNNENRRYQIAHEVGHCLGLKHTALPRLMAPGGGNWVPLTDEIAAVQEVYVPPAPPSQATADFYYGVSSQGVPARMFAVPIFAIDDAYVPWP